uniref:OSJNBb0069N01.12 protein n=1 Tax=Oryza sativa subsp. japonica TaxID=39947 RepID=Q7XWC6_ORYSJ|nr:OSJNBb0069N01.12 [Oryza sativa Japonica Group]
MEALVGKYIPHLAEDWDSMLELDDFRVARTVSIDIVITSRTHGIEYRDSYGTLIVYYCFYTSLVRMYRNFRRILDLRRINYDTSRSDLWGKTLSKVKFAGEYRTHHAPMMRKAAPEYGSSMMPSGGAVVSGSRAKKSRAWGCGVRRS